MGLSYQLGKLARYGLEEQVKDINRAAIEIAKRAAAPGGQFVFGTIGGTRSKPFARC